ncbi:hypothetical protein FACS18942_02970 [Planctomycetales bacterium]|nr:hypothetical protein FACS18942_02970 [Planctomycetales bacterium]GHT35065.1 hypothetical protein FACS189427_03580 [Planctomycetales bacterium]
MRFRILFFLIIITALVFGISNCRRNKAPQKNIPLNNSAQLTAEQVDLIRQLAQKHNGNDLEPLYIPVEQTPLEVLREMTETYQKAKSYGDRGYIQIIGKTTQPDYELTPWTCTVAFQKADERAAKIRLEINNGVLVSNGENCYAQIRDLPEQVLVFPAPQKITPVSFFRDLQLDKAMETGLPETIIRFAPQLILLFARNPLKTLVPAGSQTEFIEPQYIEEEPCDLIRVSHSGGSRILWVSRRQKLLLRLDYLAEGLPVPEGIESVSSIRVELEDAAVNRDISPEAFQMMQPQNARQVSAFQTAESFLLTQTQNGQPLTGWDKVSLPQVPSFRNGSYAISDSSEKTKPHNNTLSSKVQSKTAVLCFFNTSGENTPPALSELQALTADFSEDERVLCCAVFSDVSDTEEPSVESLKLIAEQLKEKKIVLPLYYISTKNPLSEALNIEAFPTWVIINPKGETEFYFRGFVPETFLAEKVRDILSGGKPHLKTLQELKQQEESHQIILDAMEKTDYYAAVEIPAEDVVRKKPAQPRPPQTFSLEERWIIDNLTPSGNIAVIPSHSSDEGSALPVFLTTCDGNQLILFDAAGNTLQKIKPAQLSGDELLNIVRTTIDGTGKQYIAVSSAGGQIIHICDIQLKPVCFFKPDTSPLNRLLSDFCFTDPYGNGTPAICSGLLSQNGKNDSVIVSDLQGSTIWQNTTVLSPFAAGSYHYNTAGMTTVFAAGSTVFTGGTSPTPKTQIFRWDSQGKPLRGITPQDGKQIVWCRPNIPDKSIDNINGSADNSTNDSAVAEWAMLLSDPNEKTYHFAVMNEEGKYLGITPLPYYSNAEKLSEPIIIYRKNLAQKDAAKKTQYIIASPDGNAGIFDDKAVRIDSFAFGEFITGIAVAETKERDLIIVAGENSITAWEIIR